MRKFVLSFLLIGITIQLFAQTDLTQFVNPFIGTQRMGHTFPGGVCALWDGAVESGY